MDIANHKYIRDVNTSIIIQTLLKYEPISRIDIAKKTKLNKSTVTRIISDLITKELVIELGNSKIAHFGRKPILLTTNKNAGHVVSIEIDHKMIYGILTNLKGDILVERKETIKNTEKDIIKYQIINFIDNLIEKKQKSKYGIIGIACGIHGMVSDNETIKFAPYLKWEDFDLKKILEKHYKINVFIDNEANFSVIGEYSFYNNFSNMVSLNIKTGIGMGIIMNKDLYSGNTGYAGEIGHMIIVPKGIKCPCGNEGCFEQYASESAFIHNLMSKYNSNFNLDDILNSTNNQEVENLLDYLALGLNNIITILNLEAIIINSSLFKKIPQFITRLQKRLISNMNTNYQLLLSKLGKKACTLGGTTIVIKNFYGIENTVFNSF